MQKCYRSQMNLRHLRAFAAIADIGSFARAANRLHLSQPALSRQIRALEAELGLRLFDRVGRQVRLTSAGDDLLRRSRQLLLGADALAERARLLKSGDSGILRVAATPHVMENLLAAFLKQHRRRHPRVEVHLLEDGGVGLQTRLLRGDADLAITPAGDARFQGRLLYPMHVIAAVPAAHPLSRRRLLELADLADEPLLVLRQGFGSREWFDLACRNIHIQPRRLVESAAPHTLVALAAEEYGIAILPSNATVPRDVVKAVPVVDRGASIGRWARVAWHRQRPLTPYAERFVEELVASCRRRFPGRELIGRAPALPRPKE